MKFLSLFIFLLCYSYSNAQNAFFLGKRSTITIGTSIGSPFPPLSFNELNNEKTKPFYTRKDWALFPPEVEVLGQYAINNKFSITGTLSFRGLQNSSIEISEREPTFNSVIYHTDSFAVKTNVLNMAFGIRKFFEYAPVGKYIQLDVGYSRSFLKVHTLQKENFYQSSSNLSIINRVVLPVWKTGGNYLTGSFSIGTTIIISEHFCLDYGVRTSYFLAKYKYDRKYEAFGTTAKTDFKKVAGESINRLALDNLRSSYIFKVYLKFGLYD